MRTFTVLAAILVAGCASADPWVGRYDGTVVTDGRDCVTGEVYAPVVQDITVRVERGDRGLFVAGRCPIYMREISDRTAEVSATTCDYAADDGTPVSVRIVSGRASLDSPELALEYSAQIETPGTCVTALATFVGVR